MFVPLALLREQIALVLLGTVLAGVPGTPLCGAGPSPTVSYISYREGCALLWGVGSHRPDTISELWQHGWLSPSQMKGRVGEECRLPPGHAAQREHPWLCLQAAQPPGHVHTGRLCREDAADTVPPPPPGLPGCPAASGMGSLSLSPGPGTPFPSPLGLWGCRWEEAGFSFRHIAEPMSSVKCHSGTGRTARTVTYSGAMLSSLNEKP